MMGVCCPTPYRGYGVIGENRLMPVSADLSDEISESVIARFSVHRFLIRLRSLDDRRQQHIDDNDDNDDDDDDDEEM